MQIYKGTIITCDTNHHVYQYLVEHQGKIEYVGNDLPNKYQHQPIIDLKNQALIPPFCDSHMHFASYATFHAGLNVMQAKSNEEILEMIQTFSKNCKDPMIIAFGASPYSVKEQTLVTRQQLDLVCPDKPLFMVKYDGHTCIVNSKLLNKIKKKVQHLRGYHEESGEMNQDAFFAVSNYVTNSISIPKLIKNMQTALDDLAKQGIGMIHSVSGVGFIGDLDVDLEHWFSKGINNGMQLRVFMQSMDVKAALRRKLPRIGGCFRTALDGCFGSKNAALLQPYENTNDHGVLYYTDQEVINFCKKANRANLQIEMHAISDAAFQQATLALKAALDDYPRENHRYTIIHACLPTKEGLAICEKYQILLAIQSAFIDWPQELDSYLEEILGERSNLLNPLGEFQKRGILLYAPCTEPKPIDWISKACNHPTCPLTIQEALDMTTIQSYYTIFDDHERGNLEVGKYADFVILSQNPLTTNKKDLHTLQVKQLYLQGQPYQKLNQHPILHILKGIFKK